MSIAATQGVSTAGLTVRMEHANALAGTAYPNTVKGLCQYLMYRAHQKLPGCIIGPMVSAWNVMGGLGTGSLDAHLAAGLESANFLNSLDSAGKGDMFFVEKSDHDAGQKGATGDSSWFWTKPNYDKYFAWVKIISNRAVLRASGWQVSEGNMNHANPLFRDDAVQYFVSNSQDWVNSGFLGVLFGSGAGGASYQNDNNWFINTMRTYYGHPTALVVTKLLNPSIVQPSAKGIPFKVTSVGSAVTFESASRSDRLSLFDASGKSIKLTSNNSASGQFVANLPHGLYFVHLENSVSGKQVTYQLMR
jgi:hypothetical protein